MLIIAQVLREKWFENVGFCSFSNNKNTSPVNEAANDSALVSGRDRKIPPVLGTNQITGFGGFRLLASLEKNNNKKKPVFFVSLKQNEGLRIISG